MVTVEALELGPRRQMSTELDGISDDGCLIKSKPSEDELKAFGCIATTGVGRLQLDEEIYHQLRNEVGPIPLLPVSQFFLCN